MSDDCRSPRCKGVVVADSETGGPVDLNLGECRVCGIRYRAAMGGWVIEGPVAVKVWGRPAAVHCAGVSFERHGVTLTLSEGGAITVGTSEIVEIVPDGSNRPREEVGPCRDTTATHGK